MRPYAAGTIAAMPASPPRPSAVASLLTCFVLAASPAVTLAQQATAPAAKKKAAVTVKKSAVKKPVLPAPPPPPPAVELIGRIVMPPDALRPGPPSGQFDGEGRRAAAPRFDGQPIQGFSSIKPGGTPGAWWALSDNGFGRKWNSPDYRLCIYLFEVRPRTRTGPDSRTALQAIIELSDPAKFYPWRLADENTPERLLTGADADPESLVIMSDESFWIGDEFGPWLMHFSVDGELLAPPVELPDNLRAPEHPLVLAGADTARIERSRGIEAMDLAADNRTLVVILRYRGGDAPRPASCAHTQRASAAGTRIYEWAPTPRGTTSTSTETAWSRT